MGEKKRIFLLILIMATSCVIVVGLTIAVLYRAAFEEQRDVLMSMAQNHARLIEAIAKVDSIENKGRPGGAESATLRLVMDAHNRFRGIGHTGEFTLGKREGDMIVILISQRSNNPNNLKPVPVNSKLAEPMRRALAGKSGTLVGLDYRGKTVLAAHEPVAVLNWGIVAKVDIDELRIPFLRAGIMALCFAALVVLLGALLFLRVSNPIVKRLQEHSLHLAGLVTSLQKSEENLRKARDELEIRVEERTAELVAANDRLELEVRHRSRAEERLKALWEIAGMSNSEDSELCNYVLQGSLKMTQSKFAFYGFVNFDESILTIYSWSKDAMKECGIIEKPIEYKIATAGIWAEAIRRRQVLVLNDYQKEHIWKRGLPDGHVPLMRILVAPVFGQGRIVALVAVANKDAEYNNEDVMQLEAFAGGVQMIFDQRKMEAMVRESEKKYSALVENSLTGIYIAVDDAVVFANNRFAEMHGYTRDEAVGMKSWSFVHPEFRPLFSEAMLEGLGGGKPQSSYTIRGLKKNGEPVWTHRSHTLIDFRGKPAIAGNVSDITHIRQMEEALQDSEKECRLLSQQVLEAQERERKRVALEIHDGIGQSLAAIKYRTESYVLMAEAQGYGKVKELKSIVQMIQDSMEEARKIQNDLRPASLDTLGLVDAISGFAEEFQAVYSDLRINTQIGISEKDVPEYLKAPIFRICQEAMNNAAKHSKAGRIDISMQKTTDRIDVAIEDNGVGFELKTAMAANARGKGLGLYSMRERAELSGGSLEFRSSPGKGTLVRAAWPLAD
jgi:PAS domain S-box-containing protein